MQAIFEEISVSDFFYRNRELAGFSSPSRATYMVIREVLENSLDACEEAGVLPNVKVSLSTVEGKVYRLTVKDNGFGVPVEEVPYAFGKFLYGSKFRLKQSRGVFGLGGAMALLYGQVTSGMPARVAVSDGGDIFEFKLRIDVERNEPLVEGRKRRKNVNGWHGTFVEMFFKGDYPKAEGKIIQYLQQTVIASPHAEVEFIDPAGRQRVFGRSVEEAPIPPVEVLPHPHGLDVEMLRRLVRRHGSKSLLSFMVKSFQRVGLATAKRFLEEAGFSPYQPVSSLSDRDILDLLDAMRNYKFPPPDAKCLSPIGRDALEAAIRKMFDPDFLYVCQRPPSVYRGHPFIVEVAVAYGCKNVEAGNGVSLYRFANKIPLVYDAYSDVSMKVVKRFNWSSYVSRPAAIAVFTHICSTRVPFKTAGKECVADPPEVEREIEMGLRECCRRLKTFLTGKIEVEEHGRRMKAYRRYLPEIARLAAELAGRDKPPSVADLIEEGGAWR